MADTTATVRAQILEDAKTKIEARIDELRAIQRFYSDAQNFDKFWESDAEIDRLLAEKDNLPQVLFAGVPQDVCNITFKSADGTEWCTVHQEWHDIITRRIEMASDGCHPSPIISGGDILEIIPQAGHDDIPF